MEQRRTNDNTLTRGRQVLLAIAIALTVAALVAPAPAEAGSLVFTLKGVGQVTTAYPGYEGQLCYTGVDLYDTATGLVVGEGVDCLTNPNTYPSGVFPPPFPTDAVVLDRTTILKPFNGTVVMYGRTTVSTNWELSTPGISPDPLFSSSSPGITHIVGDITEPDKAGGNIKSEEGTGAFLGLTGYARLSGAVNMANFGATPEEYTTTGSIDFNCIFVITFDGPYPVLLQHQRFRAEIMWKDYADSTGQGQLVSQGDESALFYFFSPDNWELQLKVLRGCDFNDHFWVYLSATTDVEFTVKVTDTLTGNVWEHTNDLGQPANAIRDTSAFACQ